MKYDGLKSVKRHLRVTEDMDEEVRAIAALEHRKIGDQYRFLVDGALQLLRVRRNGQEAERRGALSPDDASGFLGASPKVADRRQTTQRKSA
jgi:hypothetical protein